MVNLHAKAMLALPVPATIIIPATILLVSRDFLIGWHQILPVAVLIVACGICLVSCGLVLFIATNRLFARDGKGTLAPWHPPERLVVTGIYLRVRNPMITGVSCIILGEGLVFGSVSILAWFGVFLVVNLIYIPLHEERALKARFGAPYLDYVKHVPRWIPRCHPWSLPVASP